MSMSLGRVSLAALALQVVTAAQMGALALPADLRFVENRGQLDDSAQYVARRGSLEVLVRPDALVLRAPAIAATPAGFGPQLAGGRPPSLPPELPAAELTLSFEGASSGARLAGRDRLPGYDSFFLGNDPSRWVSRLPAWGGVSCSGLYEGVDLDVVQRAGRLEYDVIVGPGAALSDVVVRVDGGSLDADLQGGLVMSTPRGDVRQFIPAAWQEDGTGARRPLDARFVQLDGRRFGFEVDGRDPASRLVIDPGFDFSTSFTNPCTPLICPVDPLQYYSVAVSPIDGTPIACGYSGSDAIVMAIDVGTGTPLWSTTLGGAGSEWAGDLEITASGTIVVCGGTSSANFPTTPFSFDPTPNGAGDGYALILTADGSGLLASTYVGGALGTEGPNVTLDVDAAGTVTLAGSSDAPDFPIFPPTVYDTTYNGLGDAWVMRLDATLSFGVFSTWIGGSDADNVGMGGVELADDGTIVIGGWTFSTDYPVTPGALDPFFGGVEDAFLTRLGATGTTLVSSTYLGGPGLDACNGVGTSDDGSFFVVGTASPGFPIGPPGVFDVTFNGVGPFGVGDAFAARFAASGALVYSTFLGGLGDDSAMRVAVDRFSRAHVTGLTDSPNFPITPADTSPNGDALFDAFIAQLNPTGALLDFSSYLPAPGDESCSGIALAPGGSAFIAGMQDVDGAPGLGVSANCIIARCTFPWRDEGFGLPGATIPQLMGDGQLVPFTPLALSLSQAPPFAQATLVVGFAPLFLPFAGGVMVPAAGLLIGPIFVPATGSLVLSSTWPLGIPPDFLMYMQYWFLDPSGPFGRTSTNGVSLITP